jgi:hypothetical protein
VTRVAIISGDAGGSGYYRAALVKRALDRHDCGVEAIMADRWSPAFAFVDVAYFVHPQPYTISIDALHALKRSGVAIVVDADDDVFNVPPYMPIHAASHEWGFRRYQQALYATADLVTATTDYIGRKFAAISGASHAVIPNAFDTTIKLARPDFKPGDSLTVGFAGGVHTADLAALDPVWDALLSRGHGLVFAGSAPRSLIGRERCGAKVAILTGTPSVETWMQFLPTLGIDVAVAPLVDNDFNRCRSDLKIVEASHLLGAPVVASDLTPFDTVKADGRRVQKVAGFDPAAWLAAIERAGVVAREDGKRYALSERYRLENTVHQWAGAFKEALARVRGEVITEMAMSP